MILFRNLSLIPIISMQHSIAPLFLSELWLFWWFYHQDTFLELVFIFPQLVIIERMK